MAKQDLVLGIDVGTSTAKVVLADPYGFVFIKKSASYEHASLLPGYAEQDPADWWGAVCSLTQELFREQTEMRQRVAAVGVSGQGAGAILIDGRGATLRPAILSLDRRCALDAEQLQSSCGTRVVEISGKLPASYNLELKLRWVKTHEPEIWARAWKALTATSFITYRLTGNPVMNHSDGGISLAYDLFERRWSSELLSLMELPQSVYCDLAECDAIIGRITERAAQETGIPEDVPVVAGGEDTFSRLGHGCLRAGHRAAFAGNIEHRVSACQSSGRSSAAAGISPRLTQPDVDRRFYVLRGTGGPVDHGDSFRWIFARRESERTHS